MNSPRPISTPTGTHLTNGQGVIDTFQTLPRYALCAGVGLLAGAIGTAFVIVLAILVQSASGPTVTVSLGLVPFGVIAALVGLAVAWPLGLAAHRVIPSLTSSDDERGMQVIITTGVLTSMMQIILFMFVL
jgi:hypothetical protein